MTLALYDRVQETTATTGTGSITLGGAVSGYQSFAVVGNGNTCYYTIVNGSAWEVGIGTYSTTGPTLARTTILSNSNADTSPITLSGASSVFLTYPAEKSVNLDASGNVSALGTITSGTWNGSTVGVAYGGTGVTASTGANSVVLRDSNQNVKFNNYTASAVAITSAAGTTTLTVASARTQILLGSTTQTFQLPDATTVGLGQSFIFVNNSTGLLTVTNNSGATVETVPSGGITQLGALNIATSAGTWGAYSFIPAAVDWGTNSLALGSTVISGGTWQGGTIAGSYGGTGLTSFIAANNALYSSGATTLTAGTLPVAAGGTGVTSLTSGYIPYGNGTSGLSTSSALQFNGTYLVVGGTTPLGGATNPITAFSSTANNYVQTYVYNANTGTSASADFVAYTDNSTDAHGWADMGFTSSTYADPVYTVTGPNEAYILGSAPSGAGATGNLVYATDSTGSANAHQWYVGGFTQLKSAWKMQLTSTGLQLANALAVAYGGTGVTTATANQFFAAPNGSSGAPSFRAIVAADIPTLNQNTTGTAAGLSATLAVGSGGTGLTSLTANNIPYGNGTSAFNSSGNFTYNGTALGVTSTNATGTIIVTDTGTSGANIKLVGNGATTPNKTIRAYSGNLEVVNNAYGAAIFTLSDAGVISTSTWQGASIATTYTAAKVTDVQAGTGVSVSATTGSVSVSIGQAVATTSNVQFNSLGVGTAGSATAGEIRATNNITAYYSDNRLKTKIGDIVDPLAQVRQIKTLIYHANEVAVALGYDASVIEVGLDAQSVQKVQPHVVAPAPIDPQYLTVRYERLVPLLVEAIKALDDKVDLLVKSLEK